MIVMLLQLYKAIAGTDPPVMALPLMVMLLSPVMLIGAEVVYAVKAWGFVER